MPPQLQRIISGFWPATLIAVVVLAPWIVLKAVEERRARRSSERREATR